MKRETEINQKWLVIVENECTKEDLCGTSIIDNLFDTIDNVRQPHNLTPVSRVG